MFLVDHRTRPKEQQMKEWIDTVRRLKSRSPVGAFDFVTYGELHCWFSYLS